MKICRILLSLLAVATIFVGCKEEEVTELPSLSIDTTELAFDSASSGKTIVLTTNRAWTSTVSATDTDGNVWIAVSPSSGSASSSGQTITVTVLENSSNDREGTVIFDIGYSTATLTVTQDGENGSLETGTGTADDPYSVSLALSLTNALDSYSSSDNPDDSNSLQYVYVKGIVSQIQEVSTSYGNATYYISDDGNTTSQLEVYRGYYLGGNKFTSEDQIAEGDEVIVYGTLVNYSGNTPEFTSGNYIYSLNGETSAGGDDGDGDSSYSGPFSSNVTWNIVSSAYGDTAEITDGVQTGNSVPVLKLGTASNPGSATITIPTGTASVSFYAVSWKNAVATLSVQLNGTTVYSLQPAANDGATGNAPYTITTSDSDKYAFNISTMSGGTLDVLPFDVEITVTTEGSTNTRVILFAINYSTEKTDEESGGGDDDTYTYSGSGTLDDPYTATDACKYVEENLSSDETTSEDLYVKGIVSSVKYPYSSSYGTATFNISDDGSTSSAQFCCYSVYYLGNTAYQDGQTNIEEGDEVIICGKLTNYYGTYETSSKQAYLYSLNGATSDDGDGDSSLFVTNVTISDVSSNNASYEESANITYNGNTYSDVEVLRLGKSQTAGSATITIPAGTTRVSLWAVSWKNYAAVVNVQLSGTTVYSFTPAANEGLSGNKPYDIEVSDSDYYSFTISEMTGGLLSSLPMDYNITVATTTDNGTSNTRAALFGIQYSTE